MNDLVSNGIPKSRSAHLAGVARSMIYYQRRKREPQYDADLEKRISHVVEERPSYGTRRVTAKIRRSGSRVGRKRIQISMICVKLYKSMFWSTLIDFDSNMRVNLDLLSDNGITASFIPRSVHCFLVGFACMNVLNPVLSRSFNILSPR